MLVHVGITMLITHFFARTPKIGKLLPASLVALIIGTALEHTLFREGFSEATRTVGETTKLDGKLPTLSVPDVDWGDSDTTQVILVQAVVLAGGWVGVSLYLISVK